MERKEIGEVEQGLWETPAAAAYIGVKPPTLRRWVSEKRIPYIKLGWAVRFRKEDLDKFIESRSVRVGNGN